MAERQPDEFQDIHDALGIQSADPADVISRRPVLQIVPTSGLGQGPGRPSMEDVRANPTREGFNALTSPEQTNYMGQVFFDSPHSPYDALRSHLVDLHGNKEDALNALLAPGRPGKIQDWINQYYQVPDAPAASAKPSVTEPANGLPEGYRLEPGLSGYAHYLHAPNGDLLDFSGNKASLAAAARRHQETGEDNWRAPIQPSLSDRAISQQLASNPGASLSDIAGLSPLARAREEQTTHTEPSDLVSRTGMTSGALGELPAAVRDAITQRIGPHMSESDFADKYFGGMYHPDNFTTGGGGNISATGNSLHFEGPLRDPNTGQNIGSVSRTINPDYAYHGYLSVRPNARGTGAVPGMLSNQVDLYQKMGLKNVQLNANIDVGSYAWAKYGFVPKTPQDWSSLSSRIQRDWQQMKPDMDPDQADHVDRILADPDPHAIWDLADAPYKAPKGFQRDDSTTVGKALLLNQSWPGKLDLNGADSMQRFRDYVASKMK